MLFRQGIRNYLASTFPTRRFSFVIDPKCLTFFQETTYESALQLVIDLQLVSPPVEVTILFPVYLADPSTQALAEHLDPIVSRIKEPEDLSPYIPDSAIPEDFRQRLLQDHEDAVLARKLLALSKSLKADGVITASELLIDGQYSIYQHEFVRIVPLDEFADLIEVCAHGHSIFWSASNHSLAFNADVFYTLAHRKNSRLANWFNNIQGRIANDVLKEQLRGAFLNRYPFILYSRDMIRFYQLEKDYQSRRDLLNRFSIPLGYYVNAFYLFLWGMLEQLTLIAKYAKGLKIDERECGIKSVNFWKELSAKDPALEGFLAKTSVHNWLDAMADMRHTAAHKIIPMPTRVLAHTDDSKKSDEEIFAIIKEEDPDSLLLNSSVSPNVLAWIQQQAIFDWRLDKMKSLMEHTVFIKGKSGEYFRSPVISVDYDLAMLTAVMDAFVVKLFSDYKFESSAPSK